MLNTINLRDNVNSYLTKMELYGSNFSLDLGEPFQEMSDEEKELSQLIASCDRDDDMCHDEFLLNYWDL